MKDLIHQNNRLMMNKRKSEEMSVNFSLFKKRKLHEVGNRQTFDTVRVSNLDDKKSGRLKGWLHGHLHQSAVLHRQLDRQRGSEVEEGG